ncbi:MAG: helix-turn-helix domain-containing protein [Methanosarcinaceae archaeon]|jgi:putative transcriptional regulator|nr:helix-turn-helix domain-containing protein [Methanosarcinaceae archaeon]NKQ39393.1 helix-turn-helix domain-containing protein [Methanosarcinales archaeon]
MNGITSHNNIRYRLAEKMAGEVTLSENPGSVLKKWRLNFKIAQNDLSAHLNMSPSVISDYESGRRLSPGTVIVSKIIKALLDIDLSRGGQKIHAYEKMLQINNGTDEIYSTYEYTTPIKLTELISLINAEIIYKGIDKQLYGFTIIDSQKTILELSSHDFQKLYGWSTERAMIFTKVSSGKSPMAAIRVTNLKPGVVVMHGLTKDTIDPLVKKMAEIDRIPLLTTRMEIEDIKKILQEKVNI